MKNRFFKILGLVVGIASISLIYFNSSFFIKNQEWKYAEGLHIGDWLKKSTFQINDRIIQTDIGKARIVFSFGTKLIIENIDTEEKGFYINKS